MHDWNGDKSITWVTDIFPEEIEKIFLDPEEIEKIFLACRYNPDNSNDIHCVSEPEEEADF